MTDAKNQLKIASLETQIALYKKNLENAAERYSIIRKKKRALKKQVERLTWIMRAALPPSRLDVLLQQPVDFGYKKQPERSVAEFPRTWEIERKSAIETPPVQEMSDVSESEEESTDEEQIKRERELDTMFVERPSTTELVAHYFQGKSSVSLTPEQQAIADADGTKLHNAMEVAMQWPSREPNDPVPELVCVSHHQLQSNEPPNRPIQQIVPPTDNISDLDVANGFVRPPGLHDTEEDEHPPKGFAPRHWSAYDKAVIVNVPRPQYNTE